MTDRITKIEGNFSSQPPSNTMSSVRSAQPEPSRLAPGIDFDGRRQMELLRQAQQGDRGAYGQLVLSYQDRLYNAVLRLVGDPDEAIELTQEAFTRGLMKIGTYRGDAAPYTWLFRIAVNLAISQLRKVHRHRVFSLSTAAGGQSDEGGPAGRQTDPAAPPPDEQAQRRECQEQVIAALGRLDAEYRAVLVMRDIEGFDYQQMADVLGLPLGTLKSRLFRARLALRDELKAYLQ